MVTQAVKRVATYERVSSEDQKERDTILTQTEELARRFAVEPGVELVERYVDDGVSGTVPFADRPAGGRLMADAARGRFDEVWVYRIDRLGRDDVDPLVVWQQLERLSVKVFSITEGASDPFMYHIRVAVAAQERRDFLKRSGDGMNRAARDGRYCGGIVALGYTVEGKRPDARLVPSVKLMWGDLTEADVVRKIYHLLAVEGWSCRRIAQEFNVLGISTAYQRDGRGIRNQRTQSIWRAGRVRNLVVNPVYRGELQYGRRTTRLGGREVISAPVPRLVSDEVWYAAQEALARNRIMAKNAKRKHLLRSVIRCGICGLTYCGAYFTKESWYRCNGQLVERGPIEGRCPGKSVKADFLEPLVWSDIERFLRNPGDLLTDLEAEANDEASGAVAEAERVTLYAALHDLEVQRHRVLDMQVRGRVTDSEADTHLDRIAADRAEIEKRLEALQLEALQPEAEKPEPAPPIDLMKRLNQMLDEGLSDEERQEVVRLLVSRIVIDTEVLDGRKKRATARIEYRFPRVASTCTGTREGLNYIRVQRVVAV